MVDRRTATLVLALAAAGWPAEAEEPPRITQVRPLALGPSAPVPVSSWAADASRIYYVGWSRGEYRLAQVAIGGGDASEVETPPEFRSGFDISGYVGSLSAVVCLAEPGHGGARHVWLVPVPRGAARRLGAWSADSVAVSPDGQRLVLAQGSERRLMVVGADGAGVRELTTTPAPPANVSWAPDGRRLRFVARASDQAEPWIWETTTTPGAPSRPLWPGLDGRWTADGRFFVTQRREHGSGRLRLFVSRDATGLLSRRVEPLPLTTVPLEFSRPASRPGGEGLLVVGLLRRGELLRYDAARKAFRPELEGASVLHVDVSQDGQWLAWTSWPDRALWRASADGSRRVQLTREGLAVELPRWSPDGRWIAFAGRPAAGGPRSVSVVSRDGGAVKVLSQAAPGRDHWDVCWLDERTLVFSHLLLRQPGLFRVDLETGRVQPWAGAEGLVFPKCGPRGRVFAVEAPAFAVGSAFLPEVGRWEELRGAPIVYPNWTRDGAALVGLHPGQLQLVRFSLATRRSLPVVDMGELPLLFNEGAPFVGLDATDAPLTVRDAGSSALYVLEWEAPLSDARPVPVTSPARARRP